jgi:hypothetical protein
VKVVEVIDRCMWQPGQAPRVISWFHPGSSTGHDFVYRDIQE